MTSVYPKVFRGAALAATLMLGVSAQAVTVQVPDSNGANGGANPWQTFMNVFELPSNGGGFVFGSGWGVADAVVLFDDGANTMTLQPNQIMDPNQFWYQDTCGCAADPANPGGPGQAGNKIMEAVTFIADDSLVGQTITFEGTVLSNTYTAAHEAFVMIRDFAPDFSSFNEVIAPATPGPFSITLATDPTPGRHIQYGVISRGVNVWPTDAPQFGEVVLSTVPEPASLGLMGLGVLAMLRRKRLY